MTVTIRIWDAWFLELHLDFGVNLRRLYSKPKFMAGNRWGRIGRAFFYGPYRYSNWRANYLADQELVK